LPRAESYSVRGGYDHGSQSLSQATLRPVQPDADGGTRQSVAGPQVTVRDPVHYVRDEHLAITRGKRHQGRP